jgi:hypothetical protein
MKGVRIGDDEEYEFDFANPNNREVMAIEKIFNGTWQEFGVAMRAGSITATTCFVYVLRRRTNNQVKFNDVSFNIKDFRIVDDDEPEPEGGAKGQNPTEPTVLTDIGDGS